MLSCAICADLLLATESVSSTLCGHVLHTNCIFRWLSSNRTCPQCRHTCDKNTVHRVFLPEHQFENNDILEKLNEISVQKKEQESIIKNLESQKRKLEHELKLKKKQYHKALQRQKYEKHGKANIPRQHNLQHQPSTSSSSHSLTSASNSTTNEKTPSSSSSTRHKRNLNRINRSKEYFRQKRAAHRNNNNNNNNTINASAADRPPNVIE
ncbi:hypothetical protein PVAND_007821 [Polypedilum vanderplanki]|uniref:RING-type domain-containing protein n=1 Tax=Polypedilum vanderplanki TaxID=319348 RepID=A0A9J6C7V8_POLVA|nr:hypothetical protein PVAND_007821 [Polypedilum vanderplanki]